MESCMASASPEPPNVTYALVQSTQPFETMAAIIMILMATI